MKNDEEIIQRFEKICRQAGLRSTPQRFAVYKALAGSTAHPSADSVYKQVRWEIPHISFDTVNRTLNKFSQTGVAFIVEGSGDVKRFDGNLQNHQHFKCIKCKKIIDFHHDPFDDIQLPEDLNTKFNVLRKSVLLEGLCSDCRDDK